MDGSTGKDDLGDRMKRYESAETDRVFEPSLPLIARLDGRAFHTFTRGMQKPFDHDLSNIMREVTAHLIEKTHARIGYTQSDEITLIFYQESPESQPLFGGRCFKIASVLAGMASAKFALLAHRVWSDRVEANPPQFDCRAFNVPSVVEAVNHLVWRENDASRNAVQMVAQAHFSPKKLHGKSCDELENMLSEIGVSMDDFAPHLRHGRYLARETVMMTLDEAALARIPEKHRPTGPIMRSRVADRDIGPLRAKQNRVALVFAQQPPALKPGE